MELLTKNQLAKFEKDGFLVLPNLLNQIQVKRYNELFDRTFDKAVVSGKVSHEYLEEVLEDLRKPLTNIFKQVFGEDAKLGGVQAESKSANNGLETPWHQDEAYWNEETSYHGGAIWITLRDMPLEKGCVQYIPGSHKFNVLEHGNTIFDRNIDGFEIDESLLDLSKLVSCPVLAGDALIHHSRTIHRGTKNTTSEPRRTYIVTGGRKLQSKTNWNREFSWQQKSPLYNSVVDLMNMDKVEFPLIAGWWEPKETILTGDGGKTLSSFRPGKGSKDVCGWPCANGGQGKRDIF